MVYTVSHENDGKQILYHPLPYKDLLKSKKHSFLNNYRFLEESLEQFSEESNHNSTELFVIKGYQSSMEMIRSAIAESKETILLSCWKKEYEEIENVLFEAYERKVYITLLIFDEWKLDIPWKYFSHYNDGKALHRHQDELSIVIDQQKAILLDSLKGSSCAIVSTHPIMLSNVRNYIRHDIYVNRILHDFRKEMTDYYGNDLQHLIHDF